MSQAPAAHSNAQAELNRKKRLNILQKSIYGSGALSDGMANAALGLLFFYMTAVRGLSGSLAGLSFVIALLIDSVADPLIGSLSDHTRTIFGRRHPWMFVSALPLALFLGMLFSAPSSLTEVSLFLYMTVAAVGTRVSLSLFAVPHVALGAELSDDYIERSNIVAYRAVFNVVAAIAGPLLIYRVFTHNSTELLHRGGYTPFGWACAAIAFVAAMGCTLGTRETLSRLHLVTGKASAPLLTFYKGIRDALRHRHFLILFVGSLIYFVSQGIINQLAIHNAIFFYKLSNEALFSIQVFGAAGAVIGFPLTAWLQRHVDKHVLLMVTLIIDCAGAAIFPMLRLADIVPASGPGLMIPILVLKFLDGGAQILIAITYYSMTADAADEHEYLFHARREGLFFAGLAFSNKAASALGAFIAGRALDLIGFPTAIAAKGPSLHIPARTITELALICGPGAYTLMASAALLVLLIRFRREDLVHIQEALSERRLSHSAKTAQGVAAVAPTTSKHPEIRVDAEFPAS